jgi:lipase chaperone LimK
VATFTTPFWIALAGVTAVAGGVAYLSRPQPDPTAGSSARAMAAIERNTPALADVAVPQADDDDRVPTVAALPAGSPFSVDSLGRLLVSEKTLAVLDSWLALAGRGQALAPLEARLRSQLPALAAERAWGLLQRHAAYREDERELLKQLKTQAPLSARELLDRQMALRRRHFDSVSVQELFGVQEARGLYASEVARILADPSLSEAQQHQRLLALRMSLPPEVAAQEFGGTEFSFAMEKQVAEMRSRGESDAEVTFLRRQFVDTEGAKSVVEIEREKFDAERQAWELRHASFIRERDQIYASDLDVPEKQQRLERLLQAHFGPAERERARALAGL